MTTEVAPIGKPELTVSGDTYRLTWPCGVDAELERFSEHRDELTAEVTLRSRREPRPGLLHSARLNLMSTQARKTLAQALDHREPDVEWSSVIEGMCFLARERYRAGDPSIDLRFLEPTVGDRWLLEPFIERGGPTVLFADGGTGKSLMGLAMAISIATAQPVLGRPVGSPCAVMYLDFETDSGTIEEHYSAILAGAGIADRPPVYYRRQVASLAEAAPTIRREIAQLDVGFVVVDSLGAGRGGEPESADTTIRLFNAARSFGVPWLGIDHVTKANGNNGSRPFGSAFTHNLARLTWGADKAQEEGVSEMTIALRNFKRNNGRALPQRAYRLAFESDAADRLLSVRFGAVDVASVPEFSGRLPLKQQILHELTGGPLAIKDLAEALGKDLKLVSARAGELRKAGRLVRIGDRVALAAITEESA